MKTVVSTLVFLALATSFGGCETKDRFAEAAFQYRVDSTVNARLDQLQNQLQKRNDSLILEAARTRAAGVRKARQFTPPPPPAATVAPPDSAKASVPAVP